MILNRWGEILEIFERFINLLFRLRVSNSSESTVLYFGYILIVAGIFYIAFNALVMIVRRGKHG